MPYGITGFGSAAAYAKALGMKDHVTKLQGIVSDIYGADELTSQMSERVVKLAAKHAKNRLITQERYVRLRRLQSAGRRSR